MDFYPCLKFQTVVVQPWPNFNTDKEMPAVPMEASGPGRSGGSMYLFWSKELRRVAAEAGFLTFSGPQPHQQGACLCFSPEPQKHHTIPATETANSKLASVVHCRRHRQAVWGQSLIHPFRDFILTLSWHSHVCKSRPWDKEEKTVISDKPIYLNFSFRCALKKRGITKIYPVRITMKTDWALCA